MVGIYSIKNKLNNRYYVGQSVNIEKRIKRHKTDAFNPNSKSYDYPLMRAIRKHGIENFEFKVIVETKVKDLNKAEIKWIEVLDSLKNGYNQKEGGVDSATFQKLTKVMLDEIIEELLYGNHNHSEIATMYGISTEMVQGINTGRHWRRDIEYPIRVSSNSKGLGLSHLCPICSAKVSEKGNNCVSCSRMERRLVERPSKEELVKMIYESSFTAVSKLYGVSVNAIKKWCGNYGLGTKLADIKAIYEK